MNDGDLVSVETFIGQVWNIEGIKVDVNPKDGYVRPYNYKRMSDDSTVDDLKERIRYCLAPFRYVVKV